MKSSVGRGKSIDKGPVAGNAGIFEGPRKSTKGSSTETKG